MNKDGQVKLDDIAKIYDVSKNPDVLSGKKQPKEVYLEFMKQWDTQVPDGIITFEEFSDYFSQVSASIDSDQYFAEMMKNAWKLDWIRGQDKMIRVSLFLIYTFHTKWQVIVEL